MAVMDRRSSRATGVAALLLGLQAALAALSGLLLLALSRRWHRLLVAPNFAHRAAALGVVTLVASVVLIVLATGVASRHGWARITAVVIETMIIAMNVVRLPFQPFAGAIGLALGGAIIALLFTGYDNEELPRGGASGATAGGGEPAATR